MLTPRQLEVLQHALGLDQYGRGEMYRNHFCAGMSDPVNCYDFQDWVENRKALV